MIPERFPVTPLQPLGEIGGNRIYIKREDLLPYSFGGNKVRIGIRYLKDMRETGCDHLVAYGNARSNLCRVLSNLCAGEGIPLTVITPADDDGEQRFSFNGALCSRFGARTVPCLKTNVGDTVERVLKEITAAGQKPYYIYGDRTGQGNRAVPADAYVTVYSELIRQCRGSGITPDAIVLTCGTGMTAAGLMLGQLLSGDAAPDIRCVSIARSAAAAAQHICSYGQAWLKEYAPEKVFPAEKVHITDRYTQSYGQTDEETRFLIRDLMRRYGLPLDETYTGKAFSGMLRQLESEGVSGKEIVFIHTGGTPLFFDSLLK